MKEEIYSQTQIDENLDKKTKKMLIKLYECYQRHFLYKKTAHFQRKRNLICTVFNLTCNLWDGRKLNKFKYFTSFYFNQ